MNNETMRTGGQVLVDQLRIHGVNDVFCVPGESYLAALDAMHDSNIDVTVCRQEGGAAIMAEAYGKLTGRPGICFVTRGPGATNASAGLHIAQQDSSPMILFVGQIERNTRGREAFQELDYKAVFGPMVKWATEIDSADRIPELVARAFHVATNGRPGPVVIALPEDMLCDMSSASDARAYNVFEPVPSTTDIKAVSVALAKAKRPLVIAGGSRWSEAAVAELVKVSETHALPVAVSFRRQSLFPCDHPNFAGILGFGSDPALLEYAANSDLILLVGGRMSEVPSQSYELFDIPNPKQTFIHIHPDSGELGRVYQPDIGINTSPDAFISALATQPAPQGLDRAAAVQQINTSFRAWSTPPSTAIGPVDVGQIIQQVNAALPPTSVICNGAGNYAGWVHRFYRHTQFGTQLAPTSGSMGYGVPAAIAAAKADPTRPAVAFAGDGCFMMHGQEFATAVQFNLPVIVILVDNGMYGTIRMHQENNYPGRVIATKLTNPDFTAYATAFGGHGERVETTKDFAPALDRAVASGKPAIIHCLVDPEALTVERSLSTIREHALQKQAAATQAP